jgi:hypothetical protein
MTTPKHISQSLMTLLINPLVLDALDRSTNIEPAAVAAMSFWNYNLHSRKPSPAYNDYGVFTGTDLDLACFLYALSGRGAVINIPDYKTGSRKTIREDQKRISSTGHGAVLGVQSNKDFFKFSVKIFDENVVGTEKVGDYRTYSLTNHTGTWYNGWSKIEFVPTLNENKFITENKLWSGNRIVFSNFIHPNRWTSFFGQHYVISKLVIERLAEEAKHLNAEVAAMQREGIVFLKGEGPAPYVNRTYGATVSQKFDSFQVKIFVPELDLKGEYPKIEHNQKNLVETYEKKKRLLNMRDSIQFMTRATEYAHYINPDWMPAWIKNTKWEDGFNIPGGRVNWQRLKLFQPEVGKHAVSILKRTYQKAAQVSAD